MKIFIITLCFILNFCFCPLALAENINISSKEAVQFFHTPLPGMIFLDIRTPQEYTTGHIPGAKLIDFYAPDFENQIANLDRNTPYILYCGIGKRSARAFEIMKEMGFTNVYHMEEGIMGWNTNDFPINRKVMLHKIKE